MRKIAALGAPIGIALALLCSPVTFAGDDLNPGEKPKPTIYSHEENQEGDESLVRDEEFFIVAGLVAAVGTLGFLLYRRGKSED